MKRYLIVFICFLITLISCNSKKEISKDKNNLKQSDLENISEYKKIDDFSYNLELGKNEDNNVCFTYLNLKKQYIYICNNNFYPHSSDQLIEEVKYVRDSWSKRDPVASDKWFKDLSEYSEHKSIRHEKKFDNHFHVELDKYYINYIDTYEHLNP